MAGDKERCINPWFGFVFILAVCMLIAAAIFFESGDAGQAGKRRIKAAPKKAAAQAAFFGDADGIIF